MRYVLHCGLILFGDERGRRSLEDTVDAGRRIVNRKREVIVNFERRVVSDVEIDVDLVLSMIEIASSDGALSGTRTCTVVIIS
jgi:hypothetical protein